MSHTPGPWSVGDVQWIMHRESGLGYSYRPIASGAWEIAQVWEDDDDSEMSANVRLIAAAPELLRELKFAVRVLQDNHIARGVAAALAAIRKAEGGDE